MNYTITFNQYNNKEIALDFLKLVDKIDRSLPQEAYVQGVSLKGYAVHVRSPKAIENLREIVVKHSNEKYTVNTITTDTTTALP
jgi:sporulation-control protein spo0M